VVAPSRSRTIIPNELGSLATRRLEELGLSISFGAHVDDCDDFNSSSIAARVEDLHHAFADPSVDGILTVIGGFNSNQLLPHLDWDLIRSNPKVLCGYSDITALANAILVRSDLVTYSGPHWSTFAMSRHFEPALSWFSECVFTSAPLELAPATHWSDDQWYADQDNRTLEPNSGWWILQEGEASGTIVGGNLCTLNLLQGTSYMPSFSDSVLFIEDDSETRPHTFDRDLTSLTQLEQFASVRGLVLGRFQRASGMSQRDLEGIVRNNPMLHNLPVVANVDFGHTHPLITFPIGGHVIVSAHRREPAMTVDVH
jgi:muramoyltetrapeptide carboxypeptidase